MAKPTKLYWIGPNDANGRPLEYFGGMPGEYDPIPARDLNEVDTAQLTEAQWAILLSPNGKRLYSATNPSPSTAGSGASSATGVQPSDTSATKGTS